MPPARRLAVGLALALAAAPAGGAEPLYALDSATLGDGRMAITVREVQRRPRSSVLTVEIRQRGSSVGGSMFIVCAVRDLARVRGGFRRVATVEDAPERGQMLVGLLADDEPAGALGPEFARPDATVLDLAPFAPICDPMLGRPAPRP